MNRKHLLTPPWHLIRSSRKYYRYLYLAAHFLLVLSCLGILLAPHEAWAQQCRGTPTEEARGDSLPIEPHLKIRGSLSWVTFYGKDADNPIGADSTFKLRYLPSFGLAVGVLSVGKFFGWRAGLEFDASYMTKGSGITVAGEEIGSLDYRYYDFSLLAQLEREIHGGIHGYLFGGPGLSILRDARLVSTFGEQDQTSETTNSDLMLVAGVGIGWVFRPGNRMIFDLRTDIGTRTTDATVNNTEFKNFAISLSLGYQWSYPPRVAKADDACPDS